VIDENPEGPPIMTLGHLERVVRKMAFVKGIVLQVETSQMFHVRKNGSINVSEKKTAKMKSLVDKFRGDEVVHVCFCNFWVPKAKERHSFLRVMINLFPGTKNSSPRYFSTSNLIFAVFFSATLIEPFFLIWNIWKVLTWSNIPYDLES
jgi:hypothetical protein